MPNGGEHFESACPYCKSMRIHQRHGFHLFDKWRCDKCHKTFGSPIEIIITSTQQTYIRKRHKGKK